MSPEQYVQDKAARSGSSFYYAFLFLPPPRRAAITAYYALCREVDDVVDEVHDPGVAARKLAWWRDELLRMVRGQAQHPVTRALAPHVEPYGLPLDALMAVVEGCELDLRQSRLLDEAGLYRYCHLVAGQVGEVAACIFGASPGQPIDDATRAYAHRLGRAFQLTNIVRDVGEDARRGRIYLPVNELQRFEVKAHELLRREAPWGYSDRFQALMRFQAARARAAYDEALALLPGPARRAQRPGLMMAAIYRRLLEAIEAGGFQVLHQRVALTPLHKLWLAWRTQWRER